MAAWFAIRWHGEKPANESFCGLRYRKARHFLGSSFWWLVTFTGSAAQIAAAEQLEIQAHQPNANMQRRPAQACGPRKKRSRPPQWFRNQHKAPPLQAAWERVWLARGDWPSYLPARHLALSLPSIHPAGLLLWHTIFSAMQPCFIGQNGSCQYLCSKICSIASLVGSIWECCGLDLGREALEGRMWCCCPSLPYEPRAGPPAPSSTTSHTRLGSDCTWPHDNACGLHQSSSIGTSATSTGHGEQCHPQIYAPWGCSLVYVTPANSPWWCLFPHQAMDACKGCQST